MRNTDGSFVIIFKDNKQNEVFLVYRSDQPFWNLPGGGIEDGETPEEASVRETAEETGFKIKITKKYGVYKNIDVKTGEIWNMTHLFNGEVVSGKFVPEYHGCKGKWFKVDILPKEIKPVTKTRITDAKNYKGKSFVKEFRPVL